MFRLFQRSYGYLLAALLLLTGCRGDLKTSLDPESIRFITDLGLLDDGERIDLFDSHGAWGGSYRQGSFITDKRIATYWIEDGDTSRYFALFPEIDSLTYSDNSKSLTYASVVKVYAKDVSFDVCIDLDSLPARTFFNRAKELCGK